MERRIFLAFFLTLIFLIIWSRFVPTPPPSSPGPADKNKTSQLTSSKPAIPELAQQLPLELETKEEKLPQQTIGRFVVIYSPLGGYIQKISLVTQTEPLPFRNIGFYPPDRETKFTALIEGETIKFEAPDGRTKEFRFKDYTLTIQLKPALSSPLVLFSNYLYPNMLYQRYQEIFYFQNNILKRSAPKKFKPVIRPKVVFAGARDRYYCLSLLKGTYNIQWVNEKNRGHLYLLSPPSEFTLYIGPQTEKLLEPFGLQSVIYYGFFHGLGMLMIKILYFFHSLTNNWGLSIISFAIFIYALLFPFTMKTTKAMQKMQQIQPEINALKQKYKDNPQKLQKEQIELFRKYKINPLGGCLPLFFQLPIFIALYQVLFRFVELKGASFLWIKDLSLPDHTFLLPVSLPFLGSYLNVLPICIVVVGLLQQKMTSSSRASSDQKSMGLFFSVFLGVIFYNFPSSLVLYWFVQNLLTFFYQFRISRISPVQSLSTT